MALEHIVGGTGEIDAGAELPRRRPAAGLAAVEPGDVLFGKLRPYLAKTLQIREPMFASTELLALRSAPGVDSRWLHYLVMSDRIVRWAVAGSEGSKMPRTSWSALGGCRVAVPEPRPQRAIADFLDAETARVDALVAKKRRMRQLLQERFAGRVEGATHASAVTGDGNVELPEGWRLVALRRCFGLTQYGTGEAARAEGEIPVLGMGNVDGGEVVGSPGGFLTDVDKSLLLAPGDLLFNRTNSLALVGKVAIFREETAATFASYLVRLRTNHLADPGYLNYLLNTRSVLGQARSMALPSIGQANLNPSRYSAMRIPLPPLREQRTIGRRLDQEAASLRRLLSALGEQIDLLAERRRALITAAVTGELEVPEVAA